MKQPLLKLSIRYGLVAGVMATAVLIALFYMGRHPAMISPFLDFRIMVFGIFIFFSLKELRDYYQGGALYFWQGMIGGGLIVLIATVLSSIGLQIFGSLEEGFVTQYIKLMTDYLKTFPKEDIERIGKDVYERNLNALPETNIGKLVETYFAQGIAIGFFVNIILSVILRRQPKT
jgi:hypothetical protein